MTNFVIQGKVNISLESGDLACNFFSILFRKMEILKYELPILCLIKSSTNALVEFLTDWKPYIDGPLQLRTHTPSFDPNTGLLLMNPIRHVGSIEHLIFKLVFFTINDLIKYGKVLARDSIIEKVFIAGGRKRNTDIISPILSMKLKNRETIDFFGGTDTEHGSVADVPTDVDYWFDVKTSADTETMLNNLDIDSGDWRENTPKKVNYPSFRSFDLEYTRLFSSIGGAQTFIG